nr:hypothetical protein [Tanacetum cinerariifolium]
ARVVIIVVAAAVVVISTTPVRSMTVVILTVAPATTLLRGRLMPITAPLPEMIYVAPAKTPLKVLRLLLLGACSCPEESSKSKEALHELRASLCTCLTYGMILPLQAL